MFLLSHARLITKLPIFDMNAKKLSDIELVEKSLNQLKEEYVTLNLFSIIHIAYEQIPFFFLSEKRNYRVVKVVSPKRAKENGK